jgi:hypothetical protein
MVYFIREIMAELKPCQGCSQKHECQEIYRQLGKARGPSVAFKVMVAFLLPLLIFIASLAVFGGILAKVTEVKVLRAILDLLLALSVTFAAILVIKLINKHLNKNK